MQKKLIKEFLVDVLDKEESCGRAVICRSEDHDEGKKVLYLLSYEDNDGEDGGGMVFKDKASMEEAFDYLIKNHEFHTYEIRTLMCKGGIMYWKESGLINYR